MTRFVMSLEEAVDLVLFAFQNGESGDILVQKAPACTIDVLAEAVKEIFAPKAEVKVIGIRHGEKMYETLLTNEERNTLTEFNSNNTKLMTVEQVKEKLLALPYIQHELANWE